MKSGKFRKEEQSKRENVNVWFCKSCHSYHIKAGKVTLTFNTEEFSEFVNETWNCFYERQENVLAIQ